jgi:hypothetical protein
MSVNLLSLAKEELPEYDWQWSANPPQGKTCDTDFCSNRGTALTKDNAWTAVIGTRGHAAPWTAWVDKDCLDAAAKDDGDSDNMDKMFKSLGLLTKLLSRASDVASGAAGSTPPSALGVKNTPAK